MLKESIEYTKACLATEAFFLLQMNYTLCSWLVISVSSSGNFG
ncbi:hypothetical protein SAMN04488500_109105 [Sporomusa malonica]|uniref:Uncharacterized protein n=1 Tax=Sporomusa malonica TaxID=112901 RepID=A0A1W2C3E5_9FIRM|nr:hypothetical protein SAMN04488500_109105 [Sporomusa malonica]